MQIEAADNSDILFKIATTPDEFNDGRRLFNQYAGSLNIDLTFQGFQNELKAIDKQYGRPKGALLLAYKNNIAIGCVGIRELGKDTAELKRMFVEAGHRNLKLGKKLLELAICIAKELNYKCIRLDTLPEMINAQNLYRSFGFYEIGPYRFNPVSEAIFMEKRLD